MLQHIDALVGHGPRQQVRLPEALKPIHDGDHQHEHRRRLQKRQRDAPENLAPPGPFQPGDFVIFLRDGMQPCQKQDHVVAAVLPDIKEDQHPEGGFRIQPSNRRETHMRKERIQDPPICQKHLKKHHHGGHRQHHGIEKNASEHLFCPPPAVDHTGQPQGYGHQKRHPEKEEPEGIVESQAEGGASQHIRVIGQPHKLHGSHASGKGVGDTDEKRDHKQQEKARQVGSRKQHPRPFRLRFQLHTIPPHSE